MKKSITAMLLGVSMLALASAPAKAVEPIGALIIAGITVGGPAIVAAWKDGKIKAPADECKVETVKSPNGEYYYERFVDPSGDCTYVSKLTG